MSTAAGIRFDDEQTTAHAARAGLREVEREEFDQWKAEAIRAALNIITVTAGTRFPHSLREIDKEEIRTSMDDILTQYVVLEEE